MEGEGEKELGYSSSMAPSAHDIAVVFVTAPDESCAKTIAHLVVTEKLAACVNIVPNLTSIYTWKDENGGEIVEESSEVLMILKTTASRINQLEARVLGSHPYNTPEFVVIDTSSVTAKYAQWLRGATAE